MSLGNPKPDALGRILIVEDEYHVAEHISLMLEDLGYQVAGLVPTVHQAITAIKGEKLDAVLLDANLGGNSSAPVAAELAARQLPFVVVTGYGSLMLDSDALQSALRIHKPFTSSDLGTALAKAMAS
jgi:DNA-binding response OmpR family regulator